MPDMRDKLHNAARNVLMAWALFILLWLIYMVLQRFGTPPIFRTMLNTLSFGIGALAAFIVIAFYLKFVVKD